MSFLVPFGVWLIANVLGYLLFLSSDTPSLQLLHSVSWGNVSFGIHSSLIFFDAAMRHKRGFPPENALGTVALASSPFHSGGHVKGLCTLHRKKRNKCWQFDRQVDKHTS